MQPHVEILLGSTSDLPYLKASDLAEQLEAAGISYAVSACSAHRHLFRLIHRVWRTRKYTAVYICGAGWSAALPGVVKAILLGRSLANVYGIALPSEKYRHAEDAVISITRIPGGVDLLFGGIGAVGFNSIAGDVIAFAKQYNQNPDPAELRAIRAGIKPPQFDINLKEV